MGIETAIIVGATIAGGAAIASSAIGASAASRVAEQQAQAQQQAISATQSIAERERLERERIAEQERAAQEAAIKKEEEDRLEAIRLKREALDKIKIPRLGETSTGQELITGLRERIAGREGQIPLLDTSKLTAPFAAQQRTALKQQTIPVISSEASARGLGRSTIPINQIALQTAATEQNIASQASQYELINKDIEAKNVAQIDTALARLQQLNQTEIQLNEDIARFELNGEFEIANDLRGDAAAISAETRELERQIADMQLQMSQRQLQFEMTIADMVKQQGIDAAANQLLMGQIWSQGILGAGKGVASYITMQDLRDTFTQVGNERFGASVLVPQNSQYANQYRGGYGFRFGRF